MASEEDDVDTKSEDNILYDLAVLAEWKVDNELFTRHQKKKRAFPVIGRVIAAAQRLTWTVLRVTGMRPAEATPCLLPEALVHMVNTTLPWHLAVSSSGTLAAILQEGSVEIRSKRDSFESVVGRGTVPADSHPQWRCVAWSPDESMVACARSCGAVDVFDMVGTLLFTITRSGAETSSLSQDLSNSVAALIFTDFSPEDKKWSAELLVITQSGSLHSYLVDRDSGFSPRHHFFFTDEYPLGISAAAYDPRHKLLFVGGAALPNRSSEASASRADGLTAWRVLSDAPHYKLITDVDDQNQGVKKSWLGKLRSSSMLSLSSPDVDGILHLCLSPDGSVLVGLHNSGLLSLWDVPSLRVRSQTPLEEQPGFDEVNAALAENPTKRKKMKDLIPHKKLVDVNFWSEKAIILARCSGAVTVASIHTLNNLLGTSPEWFEPSPRVAGAHNGGFLGLECEIRFPKRRILADSDSEEDFDDSEDEDASVVAITTRATKQVMYFLTDSERFMPPKKKPKTVTKVYRMVWLKSTTPEELYARKIDAEEYGEALALAQAYGLDCDLVYQRQWRKSPVSLASIQDYLSKISKRAWVLHECLERVPENIDAARELLQYGLRGTDLPALAAIVTAEDAWRFMLCDPEEGLYEDLDYDRFDPAAVKRFEDKKKEIREAQLAEIDFENLTLDQKELCRARLKLLQYLDRLKTYECILGGGSAAAERFNSEFYKEFRSSNILQLSVDYAQSSDWQALETLFTYHSSDLAPHRLAILSHFPETTWPGDYASLLPELGDVGEVCGWEAETWREQDWSEMEMCQSAVNLENLDLGAFLYENSPELMKYRVESPSVELVQQWYEMRACQIEEFSRLVDYALEFTKLAIQRGFDGLGELLDDLVTMETLVYECGVGDSLTFAALRDMPDYARIELMMDKSPLEMYAKNARRWLVPVLQRCDARDPGAYRRLLKEFLLTRARTDLQLPLKIFQTSKAGVANPVVQCPSDLMEFALEVIYTTERDDQLDVAMEIFQCLPQKTTQKESADLVRLHKEVDRMERHLRAAKILQDNNIKKTVAFIKSSENDAEVAESLIIKLTRVAGRRSPPLKEAEWYKLHDDIMTLHDIVYRCLSPVLCHQIFVESLLCSGSQDNIRLAGDMMERQRQQGLGSISGQGRMRRLEYDIAVTLVLTAAREYFDSSANLTHTCMDLARSCLNLVLDSPPPIQEELDLIASLAVLEDFNVSVLPLQVRLCKDRLELVRQAVGSKPTNYRQSQKLLRLAHLLRVDAKDSAERDGKVLLVLAQAALAADDTEFAHQYCQRLVTASFGPAWTVCVDLAEKEAFKDIAAKVSLLSFAVTFCSVEMIEPILQARSLLQRQGSPFSARAALQQTQEILSSTQRHTRAVLSSVTDTAWWRGAVKSLKQPAQKHVSSKGDTDDGNAGFTRHGCHPFYESIIEDAYTDVASVDYGALDCESGDKRTVMPNLSANVLRTARLEETLTEGEKSEPAEEAAAEKCLSVTPQTGLALEVSQYYYALQVYAALRPCPNPHPASLYLQPPSRIAQLVMLHLKAHPEREWPPAVSPLVPLLMQCRTRLQDWHQAQALQRLAPGVDVVRFTQDAEYKKETILGLAMSCEEEVYGMAVSLAERYQLPLWDIYMAHLEYLFSDSGLSTEELRERISRLNILDTLKQQPSEFCSRLYTHVYPTVAGSDHARLLYLFGLLEGLDKERHLCGLPATEHIKLLKKLKPLAADIDYVRLIDDKTPPKDILAPYLTSANINNKGGFLHPSSLYCGWAVRVFWEGDKPGKAPPQNAAAWIHRYELCGEYIQKLLPDDFVTFIRTITCSRDSSLKQEGRKKKEGDAGTEEGWREAGMQVQPLQVHLETLDSDTVQSFMQAEDPKFHQYALHYDVSCGDPVKVGELLVLMVVEGQPLELADDLVQVAPPIGLTVADILQKALARIITALRGKEEDGERKIYDPLSRLEQILQNVQEHIENEGQLAGRKEVFDVLHPFITDTTVPMQQRLAVLELLEMTVGLGREHATVLLWCKTSRLVSPTSGEQPPWTKTLLAMACSTNAASVALIDTVLKDLGPADFPLNIQDTKVVFDALLRRQCPIEGVKVILRSGHKKLYPSAVLVLSAEEEVGEDSDLIHLVLRRELAPQLVGTPIYLHICKAVVRAHETQGPAAAPYLQLETVVGQLQEAGLQAEARSLTQQAHATRPLFQSVGSALGAMGSWFKS
ncbi:hypothetical protein BaRGS_00030901 [Batillaria attramentaria]|uniref:Neuroblastoma-amplified sequence n=1 Tax=Batillaria attramentaria TaxID=370345 RepID=A0ABD0JTK9_9CAEN